MKNNLLSCLNVLHSIKLKKILEIHFQFGLSKVTVTP